MIGIIALMALLGLLLAIASATSPPRCPLWVAVVCLAIAVLLNVYPK